MKSTQAPDHDSDRTWRHVAQRCPRRFLPDTNDNEDEQQDDADYGESSEG
jgi:hypothetical protein